MAPTHDDLCHSPELLLQNRTQWDQNKDDEASALLGAVVNDGYSCITTACCDFIPAPPIGGNRAVQERDDFFFGEVDYLVWPQPHHLSLPHLPFIHRRTDDLADPQRHFLWVLPQRSDFEVTDTQFCTGMGKLYPDRLLAFQTFRQNLLNRFSQFQKDLPEDDWLPPNETKVLDQLHLRTLPLLNRLQYLPMGFRAMSRTLRALQRNLLEIEAFVDYFIEYRPKGLRSPPATSYTATVGVFVYSMGDAARYLAMGIYHWLIRPYHIVLQMRINELASLVHCDAFELSTQLSHNSSPIFVGAASDTRIYHAIVDFAGDFLRFPDPFNAHSLPEPIGSTVSGPSRSATSQRQQRALTTKERYHKTRSPYAKANEMNKGQRSKFEDPVGPHFPPSIPVWKDALINVDTSPHHFVFEPRASDMAYIVPEPASLVSTQTNDKSMAMFRAWLKIRNICLLRTANKGSMAQPLPNKSWNALLTSEFTAQRAKDNEPGKRAQEREKLRKEMVELMGNCVKGDMDVEVTASIDFSAAGAYWMGIPFDRLESVHLEQILWELHELCFRFEFHALDGRARLHTPYENSPDSDVCLMNCFPENLFSAPTLDTANHGIASLSSRERAHYLFAMAKVMRRWRWVSSDGWISKTDRLRWSLEDIDSLEKEIAETYNTAVSQTPVVGRSYAPVLAPHVKNNPNVIINEEARKR